LQNGGVGVSGRVHRLALFVAFFIDVGLRRNSGSAPRRSLLYPTEQAVHLQPAIHWQFEVWPWQALIASALVGAIIAGSVMLMIDRHDSSQNIARQVVASHIRGLLAPQPFDIASSDRHTVKPWFTTRIPESLLCFRWA